MTEAKRALRQILDFRRSLAGEAFRDETHERKFRQAFLRYCTDPCPENGRAVEEALCAMLPDGDVQMRFKDWRKGEGGPLEWYLVQRGDECCLILAEGA